MEDDSARVLDTTDGALALVGRELPPSDWVEVTQEHVDGFARAVHDWHWAHNEPEVARAGPFGGPIGHAHLTLSTVPHLATSVLRFARGELMFYGYDRVRFPSPVPVGSRIRMHLFVAEVDEIDLGEQLTCDLRIEVEGQERPACVARAIWRHYVLDGDDG